MSAQRLSTRKLRRIERATGLPVLRGWAHGGNWYFFLTPGPAGGYEGHRHGSFNMKSERWEMFDAGRAHQHYYPTCTSPEGWAAEFGEIASAETA